MKSIFTSKPVSNVNAYTDLKYLDNSIPQLFLYSNADKLIPYKVSNPYRFSRQNGCEGENNWIFLLECNTFFLQDVESFASFRQSIGVPVETVCFHDAEHVKLYTSYPQKYIQCVCNFISNCLSSIPIHMGAEKKLNWILTWRIPTLILFLVWFVQHLRWNKHFAFASF